MSLSRTLLCSLILCLASCVSAQQNAQRGSNLDGMWEGTMVVGGIYSNEQLPMQLYLTTKGAYIEGRSFVQLPTGGTLRMDLQGQLHGDMSISMVEVKFAGDPENDVMPEFNRQYQIAFKDDLWNPRLVGFWQEVTDEVFGPNRQRGKMVLTKKKPRGA